LRSWDDVLNAAAMKTTKYLLCALFSLTLALPAILASSSGCGSSSSDGTGGTSGNGGPTGTGGTTVVVEENGDGGATCTALADVDCAKAGKAYATICALKCDSVIGCEGTAAADVEAMCNSFKSAGKVDTVSYACFYTNQKSCADFDSCSQTCGL
jgi:hypothetical protein